MLSLFINTEEAARLTGLSTYELRTGYKMGVYPALEIGRGSRRRALRWDIETLQAALAARMTTRNVGDGTAAR